MSFVHRAVQKERTEIDCSEFDFPFHAQVDDSIIKKYCIHCEYDIA